MLHLLFVQLVHLFLFLQLLGDLLLKFLVDLLIYCVLLLYLLELFSQQLILILKKLNVLAPFRLL